jgi:hypothetical protein
MGAVERGAADRRAERCAVIPDKPVSRGKRGKYLKLDRRAELTPDPPFTADKLKQLMVRAVPAYAPPSDAGLLELCGILNRWHAHFYAAQEGRKFNDKIEAARSALADLACSVSELRHSMGEKQRGNLALKLGPDPFLEWQIKHADRVADFIAKAPMGFLQQDNYPKEIPDWRYLAPVLPIIGGAMRSTNPHFPTGHSNTGPLSKILAVVLPLITGQPLTAAAISNQLKAADKLVERNKS